MNMWLHSFLTSALDVSGQFHAPSYFTATQILSMYGKGGCVGPRSSLGSLENNVLLHAGNRTTILRHSGTLTTPTELYPEDTGLGKHKK